MKERWRPVLDMRRKQRFNYRITLLDHQDLRPDWALPDQAIFLVLAEL
jgi:hypothetical protein